jgi:hypothetical protein
MHLAIEAGQAEQAMLPSASDTSNGAPQPILLDCNATAAQQSDRDIWNKCIFQYLHHLKSSHLFMSLRTCRTVKHQLLLLSYHPILLLRRPRQFGGAGATSSLAHESRGEVGAARTTQCRGQSRYPCFTPLIMTPPVLVAESPTNSILCAYMYLKIRQNSVLIHCIADEYCSTNGRTDRTGRSRRRETNP